MFFNIGLSNIFLDMSPQAKETKAKLNGTISNQKASAQQRKSSKKKTNKQTKKNQQTHKDNLLNGKDVCKSYI